VSRSSRTLSVAADGDSGLRRFVRRNLAALCGLGVIAVAAAFAAALATWAANDPSLSHATGIPPHNMLGYPGAVVADLAMQFLGLAAIAFIVPVAAWGWQLVFTGRPFWNQRTLAAWLTGSIVATGAAATLPIPSSWPLPSGLGGVIGDILLRFPAVVFGGEPHGIGAFIWGLPLATLASALLLFSCGALFASHAKPPRGRRRAATAADQDDELVEDEDDDFDSDLADDREGRRAWLSLFFGLLIHLGYRLAMLLRWLFAALFRAIGRMRARDDEFAIVYDERIEPMMSGRVPGYARRPLERDDGTDDGENEDDNAFAEEEEDETGESDEENEETDDDDEDSDEPRRARARRPKRGSKARSSFAFPPLELLAEPKGGGPKTASPETLEQNARLLESVLDDFGVRGEIINAHPGPVVTLYELEPAPGIKSSRVIGLADDIARSMSAIACRVAVVPGKNAIGIELPNMRREIVLLRELLASDELDTTKARLPLCLGKTIGGEPVIADLSRMPHLLIAGTTGSGKSVAINTMILSLVYRLTPEQCRLIMIDPKMLELSTYQDIPHLLTPVVTDPRKAVVALKWTVREMEERYRKMSKVGVRNIDGLNQRVAQAKARGEVITRTVQTGFDKETGQAIYEQEELSLDPMPYIVVIIDEMADLMMVAGKEIEGAIQRLAQMARAAGIHVVMATQRPSVDVITGTIKANFPTRISFQVTSKIDSRTILGEQGAEQLLGQGDMLYMMGGGRITRVHGPFVDDAEVEKVVAHLRAQGVPEYLESVTEDDSEGAEAFEGGEDGTESNDLYDQAVAVVLRDRKASTSYIQRRLQIGYNRAASIIERMENEGLVSPANHAGKREILVDERDEAI
jgi:S-DNA-T family DNA segregation ATPase FtsK/SpoIIIE